MFVAHRGRYSWWHVPATLLLWTGFACSEEGAASTPVASSAGAGAGVTAGGSATPGGAGATSLAGRSGTAGTGNAGSRPGAGASGTVGVPPSGGATAGMAAAGGPASAAGSAAPPAAGAASGGMGGASTAGAAGGGTAGTAGGSAPMMPPATGPGPMLPAIQGECPTFADGTIMVAGHRGIVIAAGQAGKGGSLLFYWHGTGSSPGELMATLPAGVRSDIIDNGGIIAAFNGRMSAGTMGDCSGTGAHARSDFLAADQIAACAVKNHGIDPRRIYSTGCSAGGLQTGCMAMARSSYIAAATPNSGGITVSPGWQDDNTPAIFTMHGGASDTVIVTFSQTSATLDRGAKQHGSFVVNCDHGGGHCKAPAALQTAAWQFMKDHPWGTKESPWATNFPADVPSYCKRY